MCYEDKKFLENQNNKIIKWLEDKNLKATNDNVIIWITLFAKSNRSEVSSINS